MAKRSSNVVMTIKTETGLSKSWSGEWEGKWMDLSLAAGSMNRNIIWPKCLSTDNTSCVLHLSIFLILLFLNLAVCFLFCLHWKRKKRLDSTVEHSRGWQQHAFPHHPLKAAPAPCFRWRSNHSCPWLDIQAKIKVWLCYLISLFNSSRTANNLGAGPCVTESFHISITSTGGVSLCGLRK